MKQKTVILQNIGERMKEFFSVSDIEEYELFQSSTPYLMDDLTDYLIFVVKKRFASQHRFDQCSVVVYLVSDNWLKVSIEYEWKSSNINAIWYRLSRCSKNFRLDCSVNGVTFK